MRTVGTSLLLACVLLASSAARAATYLTQEQALKIALPGAKAREQETRSLSDAQRTALQKETGLRFPEKEVRFFIGRSEGKVTGYALIMNEIGKHEYMTFIVGINAKGEVADCAVMEFRESRGWEVREQRFLRQFRGKRGRDPIQVNRDIVNYTGATLSSHAIARGVKRALALTNLFYLGEKEKAP